MSFSALPIELVEYILDLSDAPLFILRQVCHLWRDISLSKAKRISSSKEVIPPKKVWCYHCLSGGASIRSGEEYRLCKYCKLLPQYRRVCLSTAKNELHLTDKDMSNFVEVAFVKNPYGGSRPPMRLFNYLPLEKYALIKHYNNPQYIEKIKKFHRRFILDANKR